MAVFSLKRIDAIKARQEVDELVIDGIGQLKAFEKEINEKHERYKTELEMLYVYMEFVAQGQSLNDTKFRDITPHGETVKEYEFKSKHLRIYAIKKPNGKIVLLGGLKTTQKADFKRFRSIKEQYLNAQRP
ncbi:hypothetical protein [Arsenicibacter rosenii]|uniref:Addiction module toxin RelE n=1 Tax=Arsenicibacter rosenii TaxID=1750698 RepID=A0A1S2VCN9_9BACT|nr:hypothetical protein [Arsenicibacter rosenii]OIN56473.1 hypothetical protein BLX24_24450 [Arsenicibacter rosenii]